MTQEDLSDILDNILGLLLLEGSYDIEEKDDMYHVSIQTDDAGRVIGYKGESLEALQLLVNQIVSQKSKEFKRVIIDVADWRKNREEELVQMSKEWAKQVLDSKKELELEPMSSWQRRIVHVTLQDIKGVESESIGEGRERHLVIKPLGKGEKRSKAEKGEITEEIA